MISVSQKPPETAEWRLRAARPDDEEGIREGFARVNGRPMSHETWHWKLRTQPALVENVWVAVDRQERPIFHYAGIPCRLRLPSGTFDALVAVDLWTLPEARRQGVFSRCAAWVHETWRRAGIVGLLGAPNEQFGSRDHFLGWRPLFPLRWQIRPLRPEAIAARRLKVPALQRLGVFGSLWNTFWDVGLRRRGMRPEPGIEIREVENELALGLPSPGPTSAEPTPFGLERGESWVRWRYLSCPHHCYRILVARRRDRILGYGVYRVEETDGRRFAFVAELMVVDGDPAVRNALMDAVIARGLAAGAVAIAALGMPSTGPYRAWRRRGFVFSWGSFGIQCLPFAKAMDPAALRDPRRWDLAGGDFDVI